MTAAMQRIGTRWSMIAAVLVMAAALGLALAIGSAEASGDEYGDSHDSTGDIDGNLDDVLGAPDGTFVQVGNDNDGADSLTVNFDNNVAYDGAGADIRIYIVDALDEAFAKIEVTANGVDWETFAENVSDTANVDIDLSAVSLDFAIAVRITQTGGALPGFDVDAVEALNQIDLDDVVVVLSPDDAVNPIGTNHDLIANVSDSVAVVLIEGVRVDFAVSGPNATGGSDLTDVNGDAPFSYIGDNAGLDEITAWLDINGNDTPDAGEPTSEPVSKRWLGYTGTITLSDEDGGGAVIGDTLLVEVVDTDLDTTDGADTVSVRVFSDSDGTGLMLELTETGDNTGVFQGTIVLVDDATDEGARELLAAIGDVITAEYDDALDANGEDPAPVSATLDVVEVEEETDEDGASKATICHYPPGNPGNAHTISVGESAVPAHLAHGDEEGECGDDLPPTRQEQQLEDFCDRMPDHRRCEGLEAEDENSANLEAEGEELEATEDGDGEGR